MNPFGIAVADVPTARQACELRNEAQCELNGVPFNSSQACPPGARTLRALGNEDCSRPATAAPAPLAAPAGTIASAGDGTTHVTVVVDNGWLPIGAGWLVVVALLIVVAWRRGRRDVVTSTGEPPSLARRLAATAVGLAATGAIAVQVFLTVLRHYGVADTAGPAIVGMLAGLVAFVVLLYPLLALTARLFGVRRGATTSK